jgi:hypothetical protein
MILQTHVKNCDAVSDVGFRMGAAIAFPCANVILDEIAGFDALG